LAERCGVGVILGLASCSSQNSLGPGEGGVKERWYQPQAGWAGARPGVSDGTVYFGTGNGHIVARNVTTGVPRWTTRVGPDPVNGANILVRGGVVIAPVRNYTVGIDAQTGVVLWNYPSPDDFAGSGNPGQVVRSRIDSDEGTVYIPAWGASVSAVDIRTGTARWVWRPGPIAGDTGVAGAFRSGSMGVHVNGETVFATMWHFLNQQGGISEAWVVALERLTGVELWRVKLPYQGSGTLIHGAPVTYGQLVIVHTLSGRTYAIDRNTRGIAWEFTVPSARLSTNAQTEILGDEVYIDGGDSNIYALNAANGTVRWTAPFASQTTTDILVTQRRVTFTEGGTLYVLDRQTGARIAAVSQPRTHDPLFSSPAAYADGLVFVTVAEAAWCFEEP